MSPELSRCKFVFVRHGQPITKLQNPYNGPYQVKARSAKYFRLDIGGKEVETSIDRLKPAYMMEEEEDSRDKTTNSGHNIRIRIQTLSRKGE